MSHASARALRSERGVSLPELLVSIMMAAILVIAALTLLQVVNRSSARTVARVDANQRARPVMERIMDELRSTCVTRGSVPILAGSTPDSISFLHQTGSGIGPVPNKRTITFDPSALTLKEATFVASPTTPNADGSWNFPNPATINHELLRNVRKATVNGTLNTPVFQYFTYVNGVLTPVTPSPSLTALQAASVVQVTVSFAASAATNPTADANAAVSVTDTALLRFGPPSELSTSTNVPCT